MAIEVGLKRTYWASLPPHLGPESLSEPVGQQFWLDDEQYARERHAENIEDGAKYTLYRVDVIATPQP